MRTDVLAGLTLAGAIGIGLVAAVFGGGTKTTNDPRASTLVSGPSGSQALHEILAELGVPVQRRRTALFDFAGAGAPVGALAVLAPPQDLLTDELAAVVAFVRAGGSVIVAGGGGGITACAGYRAPRADGGVVWDGGPADLGRPVAVRAPAGLRRLPPVRRVLVPRDTVTAFERFQRPQRRAFTDADCHLLVPGSADTLLHTADHRPAVLALTYPAGGRVLLLADPVYVRNRAWRETDAPRLMIPLLVPGRRGPLVWDEYHQGFGETETGAREVLRAWVRRSPAGWALLQLGAVALVWLLVTAVRFGPARSVIERRRRSPLEHVDALAAGLEGARGTDTSVHLIVSGLRRRLSRGGYVPSGRVATWLAALELALPSARGRAAARRLQQLLTERGGDERVLAAAQAVEDVWQDLRPAQTPARS